MELKNTVALITGASRGIGASTAVALASQGAAVGINFESNVQAADSIVNQIKENGGRAIPLRGDVSNAEQVQAMVGALKTTFGPVDILVNNAGGSVPGMIDEVTETIWSRAWAIHVNGPFYCVRAVLPEMKQRRQGVILNLSSVAGIRAAPASVTYQTVKSAVLGFTRALARDLSDFNIRVNCVCPGLIDTDFHAALPPEKRKMFCDQRVPLHRFGDPAEIAETILFLIRNDYITGETIVVDGGLTMRIA